jgi:endogenous inhibitor of DNA gyrase (YacG/DUF329 family)
MNKRIIPCPNCNKPTEYSLDNPFRPFCCERCKLIDLGEWANEEKVIPGAPVIKDEDEDEPDSW